jgi:uncharacterized protein
MPFKRIFILIFLFMSHPLVVSAASFDCKKSQSVMEELICSDQKLLKLFTELNLSYQRALAKINNKIFFKDWQRQWLTSFKVTSCENISCLIDVFSARLDILNSMAPANSTTSSLNGNYIRYLHGKVDDSASIMVIGLEKNRIFLTGQAFWTGNVDLGQVHIGEIDGIGTVKGNRAFFDNDPCRVEMHFEASALVVEKESGCGGSNVTFEGRYSVYNYLDKVPK